MGLIEEMEDIIYNLKKTKEGLLDNHKYLIQHKENQLIQLKELVKGRATDIGIKKTIENHEQSLNIMIKSSEDGISSLSERIQQAEQDLILLKLKISNVFISKALEDAQNLNNQIEEVMQHSSEQKD